MTRQQADENDSSDDNEAYGQRGDGSSQNGHSGDSTKSGGSDGQSTLSADDLQRKGTCDDDDCADDGGTFNAGTTGENNGAAKPSTTADDICDVCDDHTVDPSSTTATQAVWSRSTHASQKNDDDDHNTRTTVTSHEQLVQQLPELKLPAGTVTLQLNPEDSEGNWVEFTVC